MVSWPLVKSLWPRDAQLRFSKFVNTKHPQMRGGQMNDNEDCSHDIPREGILPDASHLCLDVYSLIHLRNAVMH